MELYGRTSVRDGSDSDPPPCWSPVVTSQTTLEDSTWQLRLRSTESYPERPGASDCAYYMRTGFCGFGSRCRFNHPRDRTAVALRSGGGEYPERVGEPACQYYLRTGTCKFGSYCKFHHPRYGGRFMSHVALNIHGFPLRPGEKECSYYLKTGHCRYGRICKFHHPQLAGTLVSTSAPPFFPMVQSTLVPSPEQYGGVPTSWRPPRPQLVPSSFVQGPYGPMLLPPGVVPMPSWGSYSAPVSPVSSPGIQPAVGPGSVYGFTQMSSSMPIAGPYPQVPSPAGPSSGSQRDQAFPERPGEPECQYYLRTGDCKFGSSFSSSTRMSCSTDKLCPQPHGVPSAVGGATLHILFTEWELQFDHPMGTMRYSPSASSLMDMPVAPFLIGSSLATLAPSSSSSDLRIEYMTGSVKDSQSVRMPSSANTSNISLSDAQLSAQSSAPISSSRSLGHSGE
ncbi:LOW QUALITY PROTEIN: Zinc finger, CCCH-type, partial [Dillenia turbinata]